MSRRSLTSRTVIRLTTGVESCFITSAMWEEKVSVFKKDEPGKTAKVKKETRTDVEFVVQLHLFNVSSPVAYGEEDGHLLHLEPLSECRVCGLAQHDAVTAQQVLRQLRREAVQHQNIHATANN